MAKVLKAAKENPVDVEDEMYYTDYKGELFIGPKNNVTIGEIYPVEVDPKRVGSHYYRIISWCDFQESS